MGSQEDFFFCKSFVDLPRQINAIVSIGKLPALALRLSQPAHPDKVRDEVEEFCKQGVQEVSRTCRRTLF